MTHLRCNTWPCLAMFVACLLACAMTIAPSALSRETTAQEGKARKFSHPVARITHGKPRPRDRALRYENLSDIEMRQIMQVAGKEHPGAILNIAGVTVGCPCEDGANCEDQVWVVAHKNNRTLGMMLSKIEGQWAIGPLQKWWLRRDRLDAEYRASRSDPKTRAQSISDYYKALDRLLQEFPKCEVQAVPDE